jgi:two-component system NarL family response regulator/two-component system nitrate/nitrite response regulator NarL
VNQRVLVADDHPLLLRGLEDLLGATPGIDVVGVTGSGVRALGLIRDLRPEIAVLDLMMPDLGGMAILRTVQERGWPVRVVFLSATMSGRQVAEALSLGVSGLLLKDFAAETLVNCLREVGKGERWLPEEMVARARQERGNDSGRTLATLTPREREISELVCRGYSNKAIAAAVGSTEGTVSIHLHHVYRKLGISSRTTLATLFVRHQAEQE